MPNFNPSVLGVRALKLVQSFAEAQEARVAPEASNQTKWKPPISGVLKLNFDGGKIGESGWGWSFVMRNHGGEVVLAGSHQGLGFAGALVEEVRACLWSLQTARRFGFGSLVIEGDSLSLHQKLSNRIIDDNYVGCLVKDVLDLLDCFQFASFSFIKREGNRLAHDLAHWKLLDHGERVWVEDIPRRISARSSDEMDERKKNIIPQIQLALEQRRTAAGANRNLGDCWPAVGGRIGGGRVSARIGRRLKPPIAWNRGSSGRQVEERLEQGRSRCCDVGDAA
ncbi:hypothetical protein Cgig2_009010 [Carnegiea gigantea]|uniref:RNase H type-1 domain-containing protein n=1 Tax=Carnegiea gigantea TaxID=171969 RepID=A0A9Q1QH96_9CARY|nr:hypothetical protein Cgig2_009010 [Carnegiea gigantea]